MSYLSEVLADVPLHYWRMADPGGSLCHDIGSTPLHARGVGGVPVLGYSGIASDSGSLDLSLDGQYVNTGIPTPTPVNPVSLECWVWIFQRPGGNSAMLQPRYPNQMGLVRLTGNWSFIYNDVSVPAVTLPTAQVWHHLVGTYDGTNARLYVDSILEATAAVAAMASASEIVEIGSRAALDIFGTCFIAEVAIYGSTLSPARITAHFLAADNRGASPVFSQAGVAPGGGGSGGASVSQELADIRNAVYRTLTTH